MRRGRRMPVVETRPLINTLQVLIDGARSHVGCRSGDSDGTRTFGVERRPVRSPADSYRGEQLAAARGSHHTGSGSSFAPIWFAAQGLRCGDGGRWPRRSLSLRTRVGDAPPPIPQRLGRCLETGCVVAGLFGGERAHGDLEKKRCALVRRPIAGAGKHDSGSCGRSGERSRARRTRVDSYRHDGSMPLLKAWVGDRHGARLPDVLTT